MSNQDYGRELRLKAAQITDDKDYSNTSIDGSNNPVPNRQKLKLQFKGGGARLGLSIEGNG